MEPIDTYAREREIWDNLQALRHVERSIAQLLADLVYAERYNLLDSNDIQNELHDLLGESRHKSDEFDLALGEYHEKEAYR